MNNIFWKNKKVFITGHTGFKGTWLSSFLTRMGSKIYGYSHSYMNENHIFGQTLKKLSNLENFIENINNEIYLKNTIEKIQPDIVFHLAAQPLVIESYRNPILTWKTNVIGTLNLLEALKDIKKRCVVIVITSDKVYKNNNSKIFYFKEDDPLGGRDPYSASKAACEIAVKSWIESFVGLSKFQNKNLKIATARAGNIIGGGDWSPNRLVPDTIKSILNKKKLIIRNKSAIRPWQNVLDPIVGYTQLAEYLWEHNSEYSTFNFGPMSKDIKNVEEVITNILHFWGTDIKIAYKHSEYFESDFLGLNNERSCKVLSWAPKWNFQTSIEETVKWYKNVSNGNDPLDEINNCINRYLELL